MENCPCFKIKLFKINITIFFVSVVHVYCVSLFTCKTISIASVLMAFHILNPCCFTYSSCQEQTRRNLTQYDLTCCVIFIQVAKMKKQILITCLYLYNVFNALVCIYAFIFIPLAFAIHGKNISIYKNKDLLPYKDILLDTQKKLSHRTVKQKGIHITAHYIEGLYHCITKAAHQRTIKHGTLIFNQWASLLHVIQGGSLTSIVSIQLDQKRIRFTHRNLQKLSMLFK